MNMGTETEAMMHFLPAPLRNTGTIGKVEQTCTCTLASKMLCFCE
jgi:hypothetical protein